MISRFSQSNNGLIICVVISTIYIFDSSGSLLKTDTTYSSTLIGEIYTLVPLEKENNEYKYMIGFINEHFIQLYIFNFTLDESENLNELYYTIEPFKCDGTDTAGHDTVYDIYEYGLTCQLMTDSNNEDKIICFFVYSSKIFTLVTINPNDYSIMTIGTPTFSQGEIKGSKSVLSSDKKRTLICMNLSSGNGKCIIYSIEDGVY